MDRASGKLTVFFEEPFWVGVFERVSDGQMSVCKITFGAEPKDYEVLEFILSQYYKLKFSPAVEVEVRKTADNPKRRQRDAHKQVQNSGIGTKSQQALQMQREEMKTERKLTSEAYGEADPRAVFKVEIEQMSGAENVSVGQQVYLQNRNGQPVPVKVIAKDEKTITFDANHEMAGKELNFRIELVEVR